MPQMQQMQQMSPTNQSEEAFDFLHKYFTLKSEYDASIKQMMREVRKRDDLSIKEKRKEFNKTKSPRKSRILMY